MKGARRTASLYSERGAIELVAVDRRGMGVVGIQEDSPHCPSCPIPVVLHLIYEANGEVGFRQTLVDAQGLSAASFASAEPEARPESR
jgi:hypothetical protein